MADNSPLGEHRRATGAFSAPEPGERPFTAGGAASGGFPARRGHLVRKAFAYMTGATGGAGAYPETAQNMRFPGPGGASVQN